jgi:hypothetical protein
MKNMMLPIHDGVSPFCKPNFNVCQIFSQGQGLHITLNSRTQEVHKSVDHDKMKMMPFYRHFQNRSNCLILGLMSD